LVSSFASAQGRSKKPGPSTAFLVQEDLRGGLQGQAGIALDLNGDGKEDLVIGAPYAQSKGMNGALLLYISNSQGFPSRPSTLVEGEGNLGWSLTALGDIDGDGKGEFAAGAFSGSAEDVSLSGTVTVFQGGDKPSKLTILSGENALDKFGYALACGDLNDDGYSDLAVGAPFHSPTPALYQRGAVYVYFGPNYDTAGRVKIPATAANGGIGFSMASGDVNGDGMDDLLLQASGKVIGFYGSRFSFPLSYSPDVIFSSAAAGFGRSIAVLWDMDGDGLNDLAVGADQATVNGVLDSGRLFIIKGGEGERRVNADSASPDLLAVIDGKPDCGRFGSTILAVGDLDDDGTPDLAVSAVHADGDPWLMTGKIYLISGNVLNGEANVINSIPGEARDMHLGSFLALVAEGNQFAAGAPTENVNTGKVRLFSLR
jgi:hypothetical protein